MNLQKVTLPTQEVAQKIDLASSITILSHLNPDADALGTALGIYAMLKARGGVKLEVVNATKLLPRTLDFLPYFERVKSKIEYSDSLIIACDTGSIDRLGFDLDGREVINIDHHKSNTYYGTINVVIPSDASASQVAYRLFEPLYPIGLKSAICFYASLLSDTRHFTSTSVNFEVFSYAKELIALGVEPNSVAEALTQRRSLSSLRIVQRALNSLRLYHEARVAVVLISQEDMVASGAMMSDVDGLVDYGRSLVSVELSIALVEDRGSVRVSLRSKGIDLIPLARAFGGGGHRVASGFTMEGVGLEQMHQRLLEKIDQLGVFDGI
jgi:phosphoesterase RecJ-like protein